MPLVDVRVSAIINPKVERIMCVMGGASIVGVLIGVGGVESVVLAIVGLAIMPGPRPLVVVMSITRR